MYLLCKKIVANIWWDFQVIKFYLEFILIFNISELRETCHCPEFTKFGTTSLIMSFSNSNLGSICYIKYIGNVHTIKAIGYYLPNIR